MNVNQPAAAQIGATQQSVTNKVMAWSGVLEWQEVRSELQGGREELRTRTPLPRHVLTFYLSLSFRSPNQLLWIPIPSSLVPFLVKCMSTKARTCKFLRFLLELLWMYCKKSKRFPKWCHGVHHCLPSIFWNVAQAIEDLIGCGNFKNNTLAAAVTTAYER